MSSFKALFGIDARDIRSTCVLMPFMNARLREALQITHSSRGSIYTGADNGVFSIAVSPMGPAFCADAVLYLAGAGCRRLIFFGACGTHDESLAPVGSSVLVENALSGELFSDMLERRPPKQEDGARAKAGLVREIEACAKAQNIALIKTNCLTVGSLALEKDYIQSLAQKPFGVMDMETAAVYRAASARGIGACAIHRVTDCPFSKPLEQVFAPENKNIVHETMALAAADIFNIVSALPDA